MADQAKPGMQVVKISGHRLQAGCVELLRGALDQAGRGEIQSVAIAMLTDEDRVITAWDGEFRPGQLVGAVERLKFRLLNAVLEDE